MKELWKALDGPMDFIVPVVEVLIMESFTGDVKSDSNAAVVVIRLR